MSAHYRPVEERIKDFSEVEVPASAEAVREEDSRCLHCGAPFCHAYACPLGNFVPDQNRAVAVGDDCRAWELLCAHSPFPEFTARICPALCEASCVHGLDADAVGIRASERHIVDTAFDSGWVIPRPPSVENGLKVAIVGAGPSGLAAAVAFRRRGFSVTVFEKERDVGGLLRYGIPCFKLDKQVITRRRKILEAEGIRFETGVEVGTDLSASWLQREFDKVVLAIGTPSPRNLNIPGREKAGVHFALEYLGGQNKALTGELATSPISAKGKRVLVIGGGDTGSDCVGTAIRQGAKSVVQIEIMPKPPLVRSPSTPWPLWPYLLRTSSSHAEGCERDWGLETLRFLGESSVEGALVRSVEWEFSPLGKPVSFKPVAGSERTIECDLVLLAMGFTGVPENHPILEQLALARTPRGGIVPDLERRVDAVGDCATGASLVVRAIASGLAAASRG